MEDELEFESFFRAGEEGAYGEGSPQSLAPVYADVDFDEPDENFFERHEAALERRDRYRRYVSRGVGSVGLALVLAVAVRAAGSHRSEAAPALAGLAPAATSVAPVASETAAAALGVLPPAMQTPPPDGELGGVETIEEVVVAGDVPSPALAKVTRPPTKVAAPRPARVSPKAVPGVVVRTPAAAAQLPSSGLGSASFPSVP
jgi:hypothetical protein